MMASTSLLLWPFLPATLESEHQDNEQELQWCLSSLTELRRSTQSETDVCYAWVHLLMETNVYLKIKFLVLLADDFALMKSILSFEEKFTTSFFSLSLSSGYCSTTMFPEHLNHFHKIQVFKIRYIIQKINIFNTFRNSKFQLTCPNIPSIAVLDMLWHIILWYIFLPVKLFKFLYSFLLCLFFSICKYQNSIQTSKLNSMSSSP